MGDERPPYLHAVAHRNFTHATELQRAAAAHTYKPVVLSTDPWIVMLDEFASEDEVAEVAAAARAAGLVSIWTTPTAADSSAPGIEVAASG